MQQVHPWYSTVLSSAFGNILRWAVGAHNRASQLKWAKRLLIAGVIFGAIASFSQSGGADTSAQLPNLNTGYGFDAQQLLGRAIDSVATGLNSFGSSGVLQGFGQTLSAFFLVLMMTWTGVKTMASGKGLTELIAEWVPIWISFAVVMLLMSTEASNSIVRTMDTIGNAVISAGGGSSSGMGTLKDSLMSVTEPIFAAATSVTNMEQVTQDAPTDGILQSIYLMFARGLAFIATLIAKVLTGILLLLVACAIAATITIAYVSVQIGMIFAPALVPFLMFRPLSSFFDTWLKFMINACMVKIIALLLANIAAKVLQNLSPLASQVRTEMANAPTDVTGMILADQLLYGIMVFVAVFAFLIVAQTNSIASALIGGSSASFQGLTSIGRSTGGRAASGAPNAGYQVGKATAKAIPQVGRGLKSGWNVGQAGIKMGKEFIANRNKGSNITTPVSPVPNPGSGGTGGAPALGGRQNSLPSPKR